MSTDLSHAAPSFTSPSPRNPWTRAKEGLEHLRRGDFYAAEARIETIRYHPSVPDAVFDAYMRQADRARRVAGLPVGPFNTPADYLSCPDPALRKPFRRLTAGADHPSPYPVGMALPPHLGKSNDARFLQEAAISLGPVLAGRIRSVHVVIAPAPGTDIPALLGALARQRWDGQIAATIFADPPIGDIAFPDRLQGDAVTASLISEAAALHLRRIAKGTDLVLFLDGTARPDPDMLYRATHLAAASDAVVQPVLPAKTGGPLLTPFAGQPDKALSRFPFRDVRGFNMAVPAALLDRIGAPDPRFTSAVPAAGEMAFRMYRAGAWFVPLVVTQVTDSTAPPPSEADATLYKALCPNPWDRKKDGLFETPRVSIYIPTYNASKYIERAIDSVLEQDVVDLEVCLADDGSKDGTSDLLHKLYEGEARVRWTRLQNGGIGYASNQAIALCRAPYIGQLDSDDRLKPGAVRKLADYLDQNTDVACVYGSCERIDANDHYLKKEYAWPVFSREKMMITSIAHHFRMFRRAAWDRTSRFREDIVNAVDYDIFLKLSEIGPMHHVEEILYQRRWHGENTSNVNEGFQTSNTYRVQNEALKRLDLARDWEVHVPDPEQPRRVTYKRKADRPMVMFWPDYSRSNPYQHLLYGKARDQMEICSGDIDAALEMLGHMERPELLTFHLHWLNFLFLRAKDHDQARGLVDTFLEKVEKFVWKGGRLIWTIHNTISHDSPFADLEIALSKRIAAAAHVLHVHSEASVDEVAEVFDLPRDKVRISRHGSYVNVYPDQIDQTAARAQLGLAPDDDVILFSGQVRAYKGVETLAQVVRNLLAERPRLTLLIVGETKFDVTAQMKPALTAAEQDRIRITDRFVSDMEMQLFFRAADFAVYPYQKILTSGSLLAALSFGLPAVIPEVGMTRDVLDGWDAGLTYDPANGESALDQAVRALLARKDAGTLKTMSHNARTRAEALDWPDFGPVLLSQ